MNTALVLSVQYELPDSFCLRTRHKNVEETVVDFLLYTRKRNHIVTFQEIYKLIPFNIQIVLELLSKDKNYVEAKYEELVNSIEGLDYKQRCVVKALYTSWTNRWNDHTCPFTKLAACIIITLQLVNQMEKVNVIFYFIKNQHPELNKQQVINKVKEMKQKGFGPVETKNNYAREIINLL